MYVGLPSEAERWNRAIAAIITGTRKDGRLSQKALALRLHVTRNTIANIETGRKQVQGAELFMIIAALEVTMETFMRRVILWYTTYSPQPIRG